MSAALSKVVAPHKPSMMMIWRNGLTATVVASIVNAVLYFVGAAMGGFPAEVLTPAGIPVTIFPVVMFSIVPLLIATTLYTLLSRFTNNANRWFVIIAVIVLVVMFVPPLQLAGAPLLEKVLLEVMHVVAGGAIVYFLTRL